MSSRPRRVAEVGRSFSQLARASVEAVVKRLIASCHGADATNQEAVKVFPVVAAKALMVKYHQFLEQPAVYSSIQVGFFVLNPTDMTAGMLDDGDAKFTATTRDGVGQAVDGILSHLVETVDSIAYISSTELSLNDIVDANRKLVGKEGWKITHVKTDGEIAKARKIVATATEMMPRMLAFGRMGLVVIEVNVGEIFEADFEKRGVLDDDLLGVPQEIIEGVVARVRNGRQRCICWEQRDENEIDTRRRSQAGSSRSYTQMLAAARAELASGDSAAGPNGASTKPPKKRVRNFTADDRAAHRIFEKKRRELFRERLNDLAKELPALAGKNPARLSKHDVIDESINRHQVERGACLDVIQAYRAMVQERDELLAEVNTWRATAGGPERHAASNQMDLDELGKLEAKVRGQQVEGHRAEVQDSAPVDTSYTIANDPTSQPSFSPPTNSIHPGPVPHPALLGNEEGSLISSSSFEPAGPISDPNALLNTTMALMETQHLPNQAMMMPLKNMNDPSADAITEPQLENGRPISNMHDFFADTSADHISLADWGTDFPLSAMDFGPDTTLQQYCF
ncbi:isoflavone reductase like P3 [Fusarium pseudoanthophilum]|uniref:Isoflavone reductase like P3 n=1 Tax=Fusarium pseudoanthophilum TaxID=48495 RepID=A0A8H5NSF5_9HYPO|nr:isoflavone reductase like P3 [Fusarium pseudoanthophilum]